MSDALSTTVARLFAAHCTPAVLRAAEDGHWPDALWHACTEAGLHLALIDRGDHSLDVSASEAFGVARAAGAHAAPIPLVETMLANWLLAHCDREPRSDPTRARLVRSGLWQAVMPRPQWGRHVYKFLLDGRRWLTDPANPASMADHFGGWNSVLAVRPPSAEEQVMTSNDVNRKADE